MENKKQSPNSKKIDLLYLKGRGLSNKKISKMTGVPLQKINSFIKYQKQYKQYSGVF